MDILHPTDFSQTAAKAQLLAQDLWRLLGGRLHVVHVQRRFDEPMRGYLQPSAENLDPRLLKLLEAERQAEVERLKKRLQHVAPPGATRELRWGEVLPELLAVADDFDLVVMGAHGANRFDQVFLGGTAGRLVRRSRVPVLTVRDECEVEQVRRVLVATDLSAAAEAAWAFALRLAEHGVELVLAHVVEDPSEAVDTEAVQGLSRQLEELSAGRAERLMIREGNPVRLLPQLAAESGSDVIVIGLRRHGAVAGLLLGSRADALLRSCAVPVLSVPEGR